VKNYNFILSLFFIFISTISARQTEQVDVSKFFSLTNSPFKNEQVITDPSALCEAAKDTLKYFNDRKLFNARFVHPRDFGTHVMSSQKTKQTLEKIIKIIEEDKFRILDPEFLNKTFKFIKWSGDTKSALKNNVVIPEAVSGRIPKGQIRLTNYAIFKTDGSYEKTDKYNCALYEVIDSSFVKSDRFKFTKQDVVAGILYNDLYKNKIKPLVWISRDGLEDAIMQGSIVVVMPDNKKRVFNVDKSNGIAYDKVLKDLKAQKRYWYFKEIKRDQMASSNAHLNHGQAIFAGDIHHIGIGKIIAILYTNPVNKKKEIRLGVLADTGGAFLNNLYQLDYFMGIFNNKSNFYSHIRYLPNTVEAFVLASR